MKFIFLLFIHILFAFPPDKWILFNRRKNAICERKTKTSLRRFKETINRLYYQDPKDFTKMICYYSSKESKEDRFTLSNVTVFWFLFNNHDKIDYNQLLLYLKNELKPIEIFSITIYIIEERFKRQAIVLLNTANHSPQMKCCMEEMKYLLKMFALHFYQFFKDDVEVVLF